MKYTDISFPSKLPFQAVPSPVKLSSVIIAARFDSSRYSALREAASKVGDGYPYSPVPYRTSFTMFPGRRSIAVPRSSTALYKWPGEVSAHEHRPVEIHAAAKRTARPRGEPFTLFIRARS